MFSPELGDVAVSCAVLNGVTEILLEVVLGMYVGSV